MRILLVNGREDANQNPGGDTVQVSKTREALLALGIEADIRSLDDLDDTRSYDVAHLFNIQMPHSARAAFETLQKKGIPIALSPIYWDLYPFWFEEAAKDKAVWRQVTRLGGKKLAARLYVGWQRAKGPLLPWWRSQRHLLSQTDRILPNSQAEADVLRNSFLLGVGFEQKIDVIPNAIDRSLFEQQPEPSRKFSQNYGIGDFVLQVGTIHPVKNQLGLIRALNDLPVPIVFIGRPIESTVEYAEKCQALAAQRGNVYFIDRLPHEELPQIYALAKIHVLPSWRETPGLVSMEAAASGCSIVSTSIGSAPEYFGDMAWYCRPDDPQSIRIAVEMAMRTPAPKKLRQRMLTEFTWAQTAERTLDAYKKILN